MSMYAIQFPDHGDEWHPADSADADYAAEESAE